MTGGDEGEAELLSDLLQNLGAGSFLEKLVLALETQAKGLARANVVSADWLIPEARK